MRFLNYLYICKLQLSITRCFFIEKIYYQISCVYSTILQALQLLHCGLSWSLVKFALQSLGKVLRKDGLRCD